MTVLIRSTYWYRYLNPLYLRNKKKSWTAEKQQSIDVEELDCVLVMLVYAKVLNLHLAAKSYRTRLLMTKS